MYALLNMLNTFVHTSQKQVFQQTMFKNKSLSNLITKLNTEGQLKKGELSDGSILPNYSERSIIEFGKQDIPIQLKDTGEFWRSFEVILTGNGFEIEADSVKYDYEPVDLLAIYGDDVLGLTAKNLSLFNQTLIIKLEETIFKILTKKY